MSRRKLFPQPRSYFRNPGRPFQRIFSVARGRPCGRGRSPQRAVVLRGYRRVQRGLYPPVTAEAAPGTLAHCVQWAALVGEADLIRGKSKSPLPSLGKDCALDEDLD